MSCLRFMAVVLGVLGVCALVGCSAPDRVVIDKLVSLDDGHLTAWKLDPGTYKVEMTASTDGASVRWMGCSCPGSGETKAYSTICELKETGQLIVENPSRFGMGAGTTVTVKVTRIGRKS
jgi:hypothetical protein